MLTVQKLSSSVTNVVVVVALSFVIVTRVLGLRVSVHMIITNKYSWYCLACSIVTLYRAITSIRVDKC